eukprot:scaffold83702_cov40-Phaeocystis_antarctica.AAC.1
MVESMISLRREGQSRLVRCGGVRVSGDGVACGTGTDEGKPSIHSSNLSSVGHSAQTHVVVNYRVQYGCKAPERVYLYLSIYLVEPRAQGSAYPLCESEEATAAGWP